MEITRLSPPKPSAELLAALDVIDKWSENEYQVFRESNPDADPVRSNFSDAMWRLNNAASSLRRLCASPEQIKTYDRMGKELPTDLGANGNALD